MAIGDDRRPACHARQPPSTRHCWRAYHALHAQRERATLNRAAVKTEAAAVKLLAALAAEAEEEGGKEERGGLRRGGRARAARPLLPFGLGRRAVGEAGRSETSTAAVCEVVGVEDVPTARNRWAGSRVGGRPRVRSARDSVAPLFAAFPHLDGRRVAGPRVGRDEHQRRNSRHGDRARGPHPHRGIERAKPREAPGKLARVRRESHLATPLPQRGRAAR